MKILHVDNLNLLKYGAVYYAFDRKISNGLIRNGHFVYDFSYRDTARCVTPFQSKHFGTARMNQRLLDTAANIRPDFLLLGNAEIVGTETLRRIRQMLPDIRIALWYVDWIIPEVDTRSVFGRLEVIDTLFVTTGGELAQRYKRGNNTVAYLPNAVDSSIETLTNHEQQDFATDLLFCGTDKGDPERARFLRALRERLSDVRVTYHGSLGTPAVFGAQYLQALAGAKMGLNHSRRSDVFRYSSDRIAQLTGNGLLTFTQDTPGMRGLYRDDEVVYYKELDELVDKVRHFQQHDDARQQIAAAGRRRAHSAFNSTRIAKYMVEASFALPYTEPYEWLA
ncbi:MAG: glycosyltransferase family protein [Gammaproteobacteria bacterium]